MFSQCIIMWHLNMSQHIFQWWALVPHVWGYFERQCNVIESGLHLEAEIHFSRKPGLKYLRPEVALFFRRVNSRTIYYIQRTLHSIVSNKIITLARNCPKSNPQQSSTGLEYFEQHRMFNASCPKYVKLQQVKHSSFL